LFVGTRFGQILRSLRPSQRPLHIVVERLWHREATTEVQQTAARGRLHEETLSLKVEIEH
jgi:hypothetical protein